MFALRPLETSERHCGRGVPELSLNRKVSFHPLVERSLQTLQHFISSIGQRGRIS
jgi:hypothetical protein